jgi:hypothetical protein
MLALETTARSAVPAVSPRECTNYALLFTPGERKALAKSKVHQYNQLHLSLQLAFKRVVEDVESLKSGMRSILGNTPLLRDVTSTFGEHCNGVNVFFYSWR